MSSVIDRVHKRRQRAVKIDGSDDQVYIRPLIGHELRAVLSLPERDQDPTYLALALCDDAGEAVCKWREDESIEQYSERAWKEVGGGVPLNVMVELLFELNKLQRPPSAKVMEKN